MNRDEIYSKWLSMEFEGERFYIPRTIKRCKNITDDNFKYYVAYQDEYLRKHNNDIGSFKGIRSKILDFLESEIMLTTDLKDITQELVEEHILSYLGKEGDTTYLNRISYLKGFLDFHKDIIKDGIDMSGLRMNRDEMTISDLNTQKALSAEQVSLCRDLYKDDLTRLFIFEMLYGTDISKSDFKKLRFANFSIVDNSFKLKNKKIYVSDYVARLVMQLKDSKILNQSYDVAWIIEDMKKDFQEFGVENLKIKDIQETRKKMCWRCPQCGESFEAIVDNWCARQYAQDGKYWIVCKENCGENE